MEGNGGRAVGIMNSVVREVLSAKCKHEQRLQKAGEPTV